MALFLGIDIGTSGVKTVAVERDQVVAEAGAPLTVMRPRPLWSEQAPKNGGERQRRPSTRFAAGIQR